MKNLTFSEFRKTTLKEWKERNLISDEIIFTAENSKKSFQTIFKSETKAYEWICNKKPELTNVRIIDCIDLNFNNIWIENVSAPEIISKNLAELKANKVSQKNNDNLVLGADEANATNAAYRNIVMNWGRTRPVRNLMVRFRSVDTMAVSL